MKPDDILDENIRDKMDEMGAFAEQTVWEKILRDAMKKKRKVLVYSTGTYKGITGYVVEIKHGHVYIDTPVSMDVVALKDIKRVSVFKPEAKEESEK